MIDGMVSQLGDQVEKLWRRDEGGTGKYPPASLHVGALFTENSSRNNKPPPKSQWFLKEGSFLTTCIFPFQALLDLYLLEGIEESYKHAIVSFLVIFIAPLAHAHLYLFCCESAALLRNVKDKTLPQFFSKWNPVFDLLKHLYLWRMAPYWNDAQNCAASEEKFSYQCFRSTWILPKPSLFQPELTAEVLNTWSDSFGVLCRNPRMFLLGCSFRMRFCDYSRSIFRWKWLKLARQKHLYFLFPTASEFFIFV